MLLLSSLLLFLTEFNPIVFVIQGFKDDNFQVGLIVCLEIIQIGSIRLKKLE